MKGAKGSFDPFVIFLGQEETTLIEVRHLVKKYGNHYAVNDLSFKIEQGHIYGFLGPNGAGKSTTMNIMTGYIGATSGEVLVNGYNIAEEPDKAKKTIGYLPEIPPLYTDMKVYEYLRFAAELKNVKRADRNTEIDRVLRMIRIEDVQDRLIKNLSKGYRQRVGMAQAIMGFPDVIILDEPTVGLDPKQIIEIRNLIRELAKSHTVLLSSHILAEVREVCDYIMIISNGRLVASDTPDNLEKKFSENKNNIEIIAKATTDEMKRILKDVPFVLDIEYNTMDKESARALITMSRDVDVREKIFFAFAENNRPILEMTQSKVTLEKIFLELTQSISQIPVEEESKSDSDKPTVEEESESDTDKHTVEEESKSDSDKPTVEDESEEETDKDTENNSIKEAADESDL